MHGVLLDCFEIPARGALVLLEKHEGNLQTGEWLVINDRRWRIAAIALDNYFGRLPPSDATRNNVGVLIADADKADLLPFMGLQVRTEAAVDARP